MLGAILTTLFFAMSGVTGQRVAARLGALWGNVVRLSIAAVVLGCLVAVFYPGSVRGESFLWFFISGLVGFGIGDVALFLAYERLGSRLTILLNLCMAPLFAMLVEYLWLGNKVTVPIVLTALMILAGVTLAIRPHERVKKAKERRGRFSIGVIAALCAGFGQGAGAVISRKAEEVADLTGVEVSGISAAFQRVVAGLLFGLVAAAIVRFFCSRDWWGHWKNPLNRKMTPWILGAALFGPVIGVSCFQWSLKSQESGIVLSVVATTPIVMMPLSALTEGDRPTILSIVGAVIAVSGVILLNLWV